MTEPVISCPRCGGDVKLTETLAKPLLELERQKLDRERREHEAVMVRREAAARTAEAEAQQKLAAAQRAAAEIEVQVQARLKTQAEAIARDESRKAREASAAQLQALQDELNAKSTRLAEAQKVELQLRQERTRLQEERERFELDKQRAIDAERARIRELALKDAAEQHRLKDAEKEKIISDMRAQLEEMRRKAEQGSQQLQGEVHELDLEATLRAAFPHDVIEPVPKGLFGGDILQSVVGASQSVIGQVLWEAKRTKNWSDAWLAKLKADQREARADAAIIVSTAMPKGCDTFVEMEGVWVTSTSCAIPLAHALRGALKELARARSAAEGQQTKTELVYSYLTGPGFRRRVEAIKEAFDSMLADLEAEQRVIKKQWAKREAQIRTIIDSTVGLYGDVQGIAGRSIPEIEGLDIPALEGAPTITVKSLGPTPTPTR